MERSSCNFCIINRKKGGRMKKTNIMKIAVAVAMVGGVSPNVGELIGSKWDISSVLASASAAEGRGAVRRAGGRVGNGSRMNVNRAKANRGRVDARRDVRRDVKRVNSNNINVNKNINIDRVDVHHHGHHGHHGHHHGPGPGAVVAGAVAGMAIGAMIASLPKNGCSQVIVNGVTYYNCSGTYYQPAPNGYVVVAPPR